MNVWLKRSAGNGQRVQPWTRAALAGCVLVAGAASAANFPVSGTITVNGNAGALPSGGTFGPSSYDGVTGAISSGQFTFPQSELDFNSQFGPVTVTYQLSQTNTSNGQVASDGTAALSQVILKLEVLLVTINSVPVSTGNGTCIFQPIDLDLAGTGSASGLDLTDPVFTIPPVGATDCGAFSSQINDNIAGNNNSAVMHLAGDFTPPPNDDTIFKNGFDTPNAAE